MWLRRLHCPGNPDPLLPPVALLYPASRVASITKSKPHRLYLPVHGRRGLVAPLPAKPRSLSVCNKETPVFFSVLRISTCLLIHAEVAAGWRRQGVLQI